MNFLKDKTAGIKDYLSLAIKLILILSIGNAIYSQLWHIMSTNIFLLILMFMPQILRKSQKIKIPTEFEILLIIFILATFFLTKVQWIVAPVLFGIATGLIGFLILLILYSNNKIKKNKFMLILFSFNFTIAFGFAVELAKYYLKLILGQTFSAGLYSYSMQTMTYVILGGAIASFFGYFYMKEKTGFLKKIVHKFKKENPNIFNKDLSEEEILELLSLGESENLEFKSTLRKNLHTNEFDKKIEHSVLKTICAFLNSKGGDLIIGITNSGEIIGIEKDNFEDSDKFKLHFTNIFKQRIGKKYLRLINTELVKIKDKYLFKIETKESDKPIFLKEGKDEEFYIRAGPSSAQISGSELIEYIEQRFRKES